MTTTESKPKTPKQAPKRVDVIPPLLLTQEEAANVLRISPRMLWQLTKDGEIKCKKIGGLVRYRHKDIQAWSES